MHRSEQDAPAPADAGYRQSYPDFGGAAPDPMPGGTLGSSLGSTLGGGYGGAQSGGGDFYDDTYQGDGPGAIVGNNGAADGRYPGGDSDGGSDIAGLPRRVRQASLAPELRGSAAAAAGGAGGVAPASAASLSDMRSTLSAMQRGWQQGRSQSQRETEDSSADGE